MTGFIYICEYLGVTPKEFFDTDLVAPTQVRGISQEAEKLTEEQADLILRLMKEMTNK